MSQFCDNQLFFLPTPDSTRAYLKCELNLGHTGFHSCMMRNEQGDEHRMAWEPTGKQRIENTITYHGG